jgi:hypothetical protein
MTAPDLDALEKLADAFDSGAYSTSGAMARTYGAGGKIRAAQDIKALIAELKEARGLIAGFVADEDDAVTNPLGGLSLGGLMDARDNSGCVYQSAALADRITQARAFLAKAQGGE